MRARVAEAISRRLTRAIVTARVPLKLDRPTVSFTLDDIPVSAATVGARLLEERGVRGSFYVSADIAGQDTENYRLACLEQIVALSRAGHEIGCHTAHHLRVGEVGLAAYLRDVDRNAQVLEPLVGKPTTFAYPFGTMGLRAKMALQNRFDVCRGIHGAIAAGSYDRGRLDAVALENATIGESGIDALLDAAVRREGWLTFYSHDVSREPTRFGVTPELFAYAVDAALRRGCRVDTVRGVLARSARPEAIGSRHSLTGKAVI